MWHAPAAELFEWRCWPEESILYDPRSGQTHLLTELAVRALLTLVDQPSDTHGATERLAKHYDIPVSDDLTVQVNGLLEQLQDIGLIEFAGSPDK